jgi:hypothetical protein
MAGTEDSDSGYAIYELVFDAEEMTSVIDALAAHAISRTRAGARHILRVPAVRTVALDHRLLGIATRFVGAGAVPYRATLFEKSLASNWLVVWHQDTALPLRTRMETSGWGPWSVKAGITYAHAPASALEKVIALRVHLDDSTLTNGPLRVLPGTHGMGVLTDDRMQELAGGISPVSCIPASGGVVAMRPLTVHASSKATGDQPRRVLHIEYAASTQVGGNLDLAEA